jgi:hypothetical protein
LAENVEGGYEILEMGDFPEDVQKAAEGFEKLTKPA